MQKAIETMAKQKNLFSPSKDILIGTGMCVIGGKVTYADDPVGAIVVPIHEFIRELEHNEGNR
jgi:hypothetical protein